ncbi:MAG: NlpC/P60 family protein [Deinococcus sp.]|nr:NlpC/P60 family protein [Deinococcus sp.]
MLITADPLSLSGARLSRALLLGLVCCAPFAGGAAAQSFSGADNLPGTPPEAPPAAAAPRQLFSYNQITVQRGDTAYSLAREYGLSVPQLLELNDLSTHDLEVGQVLKVAAIAPHQVVKGDTLYSLARTRGLTVEALQSANGLSDNTIEIGQWLAIPAAPQARPMPQEALASAPAFSVTPTPAAPGAAPELSAPSGLGHPPAQASADLIGWRRNALAMLNTPYVYGGNSPSGVDCSSFVVRVFQPLGLSLPRTSAQQAQVGQPVARASLRGGDLVFFDTVGRGSVTHVGIYLGEDQFVNANSYYGRVVIDKLESDRYWSPRYLSARRVLDSGTVAQLSVGQPVALRPGRAD